MGGNGADTSPYYQSVREVSQVFTDGQKEGEHGVVHHVQGEHHQTYLLHHYQNASIQGRQIQRRKEQMQVSQ